MGVVAYSKIDYEFDGFLTDLYADVKIVMTPVSQKSIKSNYKNIGKTQLKQTQRIRAATMLSNNVSSSLSHRAETNDIVVDKSKFKKIPLSEMKILDTSQMVKSNRKNR